MQEEIVKIKIKSGLHARPASILVHKASQYQSEITLILNGDEVNGKSILGVISLGLIEGQKIKIVIDGEDEKEALSDIVSFLSDEDEIT